MGQVRHGSATTTHAVRAAIQRSQASLAALSRELGINPKTVAKWRKRATVEDMKTGPKAPHSATLTEAEEAAVVAFRRHTLLPLDDCLYALQPSIPHLTRSGLHRCLPFAKQANVRFPYPVRALWTIIMNDHFEWAFGYCAARGFARPVTATFPAALWFEVGKADQVGRLILGDASGEAAAAAFAAVHEPHIYVDIAAPRSAVLPHIPPHWRSRDAMWLMAAGADLPAARPTPDITIDIDERADRIEAVARHANGSHAARGVLGINGTTAVYDQIVTEPQFARRGLGSAIMATLGRLALRRGVTESLLVATADGKALYERLGWSLRSDIVSVISPPG